MAFLNPTAEPFEFPLPKSMAKTDIPVEAIEPLIYPLKNVLKAILPHHKLVFSNRCCKAYRPLDQHDPDGISYFVIHGDEAGEQVTREGMRREVELLRTLKTAAGDTHPSLRAFVAFLDEPSYPPAIVMLDEGKPLSRFQETYDGGRIPEDVVKVLMIQLLQGLEWIHSKGIVNRDLHPRRLIINTNDDKHFSLKISSFRRAIRLADINERYTGGVVYYRPPDVHLGSVSYGAEYDIWSAGCIYAEMITGQQLFKWANGGIIKQMINVLDFRCPPDELDRRQRLIRFPWAPEVASWPWYVPIGLARVLGPVWTPTSATFLNSFLQFDPEARVTATDALKTPYLRTGPIPIARPPTPDPELERESAEIDEVLREIQDIVISTTEQSIDDKTLEMKQEKPGEINVEVEETLESILGIS